MVQKQKKPSKSVLSEAGNDNILPVLKLPGAVIFPHTTIKLTIDRDKAELLEEKIKGNPLLIAAMVKTGEQKPEDVCRRGTVCHVDTMEKSRSGKLVLTVTGLHCADVESFEFEDKGLLTAHVRKAPFVYPETIEKTQMLAEATADSLEAFMMESGRNTPAFTAALKAARKSDQPAERTAYVAANYLSSFTIAEKQELLEKNSLEELHEAVLLKIGVEERKADLWQEFGEIVADKVAAENEEQLLHRMIEEIQERLGGENGEFTALKARIDKTPLSPEAREKAERDFVRLKQIGSFSSERPVLETSLETLLDMPWGKTAPVNADTGHARDILDEDHYGLSKVKEKIVGYLAVQNRLARKNGAENNRAAPQIMCLVGPPGVGKTSICQSVARATGRPYVRLALGGVSDESEIRGHRRTYVGAEPGSVMKLLKQAGSQNPVFVLDEMDKIAPASIHGDPAAALLELLDPAQNNTFRDRYLDVPFDMSKVLFIATANVWDNVPAALQDRMDTVLLGSYTEDEKLEIAKRHLVRKKMAETGLDDSEFSITEDALRDLIHHYTMESGVRELGRRIAHVCTQAVIALEKSPEKITVTPENLQKFAGKRLIDHDPSDKRDKIGMVTGLAWTSVGGSTLQVESVKFPGKGTPIVLTGNLGKVISESAQVAFSLAQKKAEETGRYKKELKTLDQSKIHLHMPEGAISKDGPSAGTVMLTALFSLITGQKVRGDVAMTGEINLAGDVLPIGGLREKLTAAARAGYRTVLIPKKNEKDLDEVPEPVKKSLEIIPVSNADEVLKHALVM